MKDWNALGKVFYRLLYSHDPKSHDLELCRIIFVQEGDGNTHQSGVVHGDVLGAVHIDSSAVIIGGVVVLISLIGF